MASSRILQTIFPTFYVLVVVIVGMSARCCFCVLLMCVIVTYTHLFAYFLMRTHYIVVAVFAAANIAGLTAADMNEPNPREKNYEGRSNNANVFYEAPIKHEWNRRRPTEGDALLICYSSKKKESITAAVSADCKLLLNGHFHC